MAGSADLIERIRQRANHLGGCLDPHAAFLLKRGLKTLALRVRYQNDSALRLARMLAAHPEVTRVNYPGLESHPRHARARALFGGCGGVLSFELQGGAAQRRAVRRARAPRHRRTEPRRRTDAADTARDHLARRTVAR